MILRKTLLIFLATLVLGLQACSGNVASPVPSPEVGSLASTIVALTFQAATQSASQSSAVKASVPVATPTAKPVLYINNNVQCRTGTKTNFRVVITFAPGTIVNIIGKHTVDSAWLVTVPNSPQTCWVLAQDASPSGSYENLPEVTPQPSTQKVPTIPGGVSWPFICTYVQGNTYEVKINLSWINTANDANGYRLYRGSTQIADLPATTTSFSDTAQVTLGSQLVYSIEAYNDVGVSPPKSITINSICKK